MSVYNKKSNTNTTLTRSYTTRNDTTLSKKQRIRPRASSFSALFRRRPSASHNMTCAMLPHELSADNTGQPRTDTDYQSSASFLTVNDSVNGGASSIDSGSDDDDNDNDNDFNGGGESEEVVEERNGNHLHPSSNRSNNGKKTKRPDLHMNTSVSSLHDTGGSPPTSMAPSSAPLEKKLSTTFKEKLNLARRSQSTKATTRHSQNIFNLWKSHHHHLHYHHHSNSSSSNIHTQSNLNDQHLPKLYDDGKGLYPPPQTVDPNHRDQYGFIRSTQWVTAEEYEQFEQQYHSITNRRSQKWRSLLEENDGEWPQRTSKFKRYVRKGIPPEFRRQAWFHYSGGEEKMRNHEGVYQQCVQKAMELGSQSEYIDIIERDLHRTFPDNENYKSKSRAQVVTPRPQDDDVPAIQSLRRLLYAFSVYSPSIGYCQSLNYIAGMLLLFMAEEEAFWTFVVLIHDILPPNVYDITMEGASIDQNILMMLLSERCPLIWQQLAGGRTFWECEEPDGLGMPTSSLVTSHWFLTLFINILPTESVLRVWDCIFYEGRRALMRTALAIFKMNEYELLSVTDPLEVFQVVQNMPKRMVDCHRLMEATYHKYASITRISDQDLERRRRLFKSRRDERRKNNNHNGTSFSTAKLKRSGVAGTILFKAKEARRFVERAKTVRQK